MRVAEPLHRGIHPQIRRAPGTHRLEYSINPPDLRNVFALLQAWQRASIRQARVFLTAPAPTGQHLGAHAPSGLLSSVARIQRSILHACF
jgi:hypothetical protein